jgi:hypothetical protein
LISSHNVAIPPIIYERFHNPFAERQKACQMALVTLMPAKAVERVAHREQLEIWAHELVVALGMAGYLREEFDYDELNDLHKVVEQELKGIIEMAFNHPEARTIAREP